MLCLAKRPLPLNTGIRSRIVNDKNNTLYSYCASGQPCITCSIRSIFLNEFRMRSKYHRAYTASSPWFIIIDCVYILGYLPTPRCSLSCSYFSSPILKLPPFPIAVSPTLQPDKSTREISHLAVWRVSSFKPGNGKLPLWTFPIYYFYNALRMSRFHRHLRLHLVALITTVQE